MKPWLIVLLLPLISACHTNIKDDAKELADIKCALNKILLTEVPQNPQAQELYDAKQDSYNKKQIELVNKYTDTLQRDSFEVYLKLFESQCFPNPNI